MRIEDDMDCSQAVFLEQSALAAFMNPEDPNYLKARALFYDLDDLDRNFVTTNHVLFDTHQWLRNQFDYDDAQIFLNTMEKAVQQGVLTIISGQPELELESKRLILDFPSYQFSLSEAFTAVVMMSYRIKRIFTFNPSYSFLPKLDRGIKVLPTVW